MFQQRIKKLTATWVNKIKTICLPGSLVINKTTISNTLKIHQCWPQTPSDRHCWLNQHKQVCKCNTISTCMQYVILFVESVHGGASPMNWQTAIVSVIYQRKSHYSPTTLGTTAASHQQLRHTDIQELQQKTTGGNTHTAVVGEHPIQCH